MKVDKKIGCSVMLFFKQGAKVQVAVTHSKEEATKLIMGAASPEIIVRKQEGKPDYNEMLPPKNWLELDSVNDSPEVSDDNFCFNVNDLLMFTVTIANDSKIITSPNSGKIEVMN